MALTDPAPELEPKRTSSLQTASRIASFGILLAVLYVAWIFYSRHASDEQAAKDLAAKEDAKRQEQAKLIFGSGEVKIVSYSVDKASLKRGESADLCYGVINATKVKLDPPVEAAKPSAYHCLTIAPRATTTYTLTASNEQGQTKSLAVTVHVR
jgi:hypothetical protein